MNDGSLISVSSISSVLGRFPGEVISILSSKIANFISPPDIKDITFV